MTLVKVNERTSRKPCRTCGSTEYYWARSDGGKFVMVVCISGVALYFLISST